MVTDLDAAFAKVRQGNPVLVGKRAVCVESWDDDFTVLGTTAPRNHFLTDVGMTLSKPLTDLAGKAYNAKLSAEKLDLLNQVDVVVWTTDHADVTALVKHKVVHTLRTTQQGRYVLAPDGGDDNLLYSMDWGTTLSNRCIDHAVPRRVHAADGDLATDANAA